MTDDPDNPMPSMRPEAVWLLESTRTPEDPESWGISSVMWFMAEGVFNSFVAYDTAKLAKLAVAKHKEQHPEAKDETFRPAKYVRE